MHCPHCATPLTAPATVCPACHTPFDPVTVGRLALYFALAEEEAAFTAFRRDLDRLEATVAQRRRNLREALENDQIQAPLAAAPDRVLPEPPPDIATAEPEASAPPPSPDADRLFAAPPRARPRPAADADRLPGRRFDSGAR